MDFFNLPTQTKVGRVIPKNAFEAYTNSMQKKLFTEKVQRISWSHKIAPETANLDAKDIREIQLFKVELKEKSDISKVLEVINKAIPYHIVFWVEYDKEAYISTASKHAHPTNEDLSVIDWTFTSDWFFIEQNAYRLNLKGSLDAVFKDLCVQLTGRSDLSSQPLETILSNQQEAARLKKEIARLKSAISRSKQFNEKVALNLQLKASELRLREVDNS